MPTSWVQHVTANLSIGERPLPRTLRSSNCVRNAPRRWRQKNFTPASRAAALISETTST